MSKKISYNKGVEFWFAHYYEHFGICFTEPDHVDDFGIFFCAVLNQKYRKESLCKKIGEVISKHYKNFKELDSEAVDSTCFTEDPVEYIKDQKYIRFPDCKNLHFTNFILRMDINPCVAKDSSMTKLYVIARYLNPVSLDEILDFFSKSAPVCEEIMAFLSSEYFEAFNEFAKTKKYSTISPENLLKPYKLISKIVGSEDEITSHFLKLLENEAEWQKFCETEPKAKEILKLLECMRSTHDEDLKLSNYNWFRQKSLLKRKDMDKSEEVLAYLGYSEEQNSKISQFIGITNSYPREAILPIQLDIINTN